MLEVAYAADVRNEGAVGRLQKVAEAEDFGWPERTCFKQVGSTVEDPFPAHERTGLERARIGFMRVKDPMYQFAGNVRLDGHG
jgi:hypothetical protein